MLYKIYCLTDESGCIRYIGYTSLSEARRMAEHRHSHPERRNYKFNVLDVFDNKHDALAAEREYIAAYQPPENIAPGQGYPDSLVAGRATVAAMRGRRVYCEENECTYDSIADAARQLGVARIRVKDCCHRRRKSTAGLHFRFVDSLEETLKDAPASHADTEVTIESNGSVAP